MSEQALTFVDLIPILDILGIETKDQHIYEIKMVAAVREPVRVTVKRFIKCDTGELKKICENYEVIKKNNE